MCTCNYYVLVYKKVWLAAQVIQQLPVQVTSCSVLTVWHATWSSFGVMAFMIVKTILTKQVVLTVK